jgi:uncharacterized membrane protein YfcA
VSFIAGVFSSLLGIGGGMVLSPFMLEIGLHPQVTAATSSFMIVTSFFPLFLSHHIFHFFPHHQLFTSLSSITQFAIAGTILTDYGIFFFFVGMISSFAGQTAMNYLTKIRQSYIIFAVTIVIAGSLVLLFVLGLIDTIHDINEGRHLGFEPLC